MTLDEFTIILGGQDGRVSAEALKMQLQNALEMLRNLESEFVASGTVVLWEIVRVQMRSPLKVTLSPKIQGRSGRSMGRKIVKAAIDGIDRIEQEATAPPHFNENALKAAKAMAHSAEKEGIKLTLQSSDGKKQVSLTNQIVKHVDEVVLKARRYKDFLTIEGKLEVVSVHDHPSVYIWEHLTGHQIECLVNAENIKEYSQLLNRRVAVRGLVRYRNDIPSAIEVEDIEAMPEEHELPSLKDIGPIDITDGLPSEDHVRRMRYG